MTHLDNGAGRADAEGNLSDFMNRYAGHEPGPPIPSLGPASRDLMDVLGSPERAATLIYSAAWFRLSRTPQLPRALGLSRDILSSQDTRTLVVGHAGNTRIDLLALSPSWPSEPQAFSLPQQQRIEFLSLRTFDPPPVIGRYFGLSLYTGGIFVRPALIDQAVDELVLYSEHPFTLVVARTPELIPTTACPTPSLPVHVGETRGLGDATVGLLYMSASSHQWHATTACHAIPGDQAVVDVGGYRAEVVAREPSTDICVLRLDGGDRLYGQSRRVPGVSSRPPRLNWPATFEGVTSGPTNTWVRATDPSIGILGFPNPSHVYTDNDTLEGDSGAALLDEDGEAIGFAAYRTAYGTEPSMSVWIWAKQALMAVGLEGI